ncbi:MAG TPA: LysR family transcriptional regulator [Alphaproteobacteria bacterium]|jgi:DNA-binding transcriptional LysR family regulator
MDAGDLSVFAAVAEAGGINRAAQSLNTVQSNVTQRIRLLERELGVPLFFRHSRGVTLTPAGLQLLPYAERIGQLIGEARRAATNGAAPAGRLAVGSLETTAARRLPPLLSAYAAEFPAVDIVLETGTTAELVTKVVERRLEGAFVAGPVDHADLAAEPIVEEELVFLTAPGAPTLGTLLRRAARGEVALKILVLRAGCSYRQRLEQFLAERGLKDLRRLEFGTVDGIVGCVGAGIGVTMMPRAIVEQPLRQGRVAAHALPPRAARVTTLFVRRRDAFVSTALQRFLERARQLV